MRQLPRRAVLAAGLAGVAAAPAQARPFAARMASVFTNPPADPTAAPRITAIPLPDFPGSHAIWGATGRDDAGGIWFGVASEGGGGSAHLMQYDPAADHVTDRGDVLAQLPPGGTQAKIHSKIIPADDGNLYFTSTDEDGEMEDGSAPPRWGSHLWRLRPPGGAWEHLLGVPEGLTCAAGAGRWIWALGLWNHVLYRYDTKTGDVGRTVVGAPGGHMSRNLVVDVNGHAYVPRVRIADGLVRAALVEFDPGLRELGSTPLENYAANADPAAAHGIIGFTTLADGDVVIATGQGFLHRITPSDRGPAQVVPLGWLHPDGPRYASVLFTWDGARYLVGAASKIWDWDWVVFDLQTRASRATKLVTGLERPLLYGSQTRDDAGRFYIAGRHKVGEGRRPILLRLETGP